MWDYLPGICSHTRTHGARDFAPVDLALFDMPHCVVEQHEVRVSLDISRDTFASRSHSDRVRKCAKCEIVRWLVNAVWVTSYEGAQLGVSAEKWR